GIAGVTVRLLDESGAQVATTTTAMDGSYKFDGLLPGTYVIEVAASNFGTGAVLTGLSSSTGKPGQAGNDSDTVVTAAVQSKPVTVAGGEDQQATAFGFFRSAKLNGRVYVDMNGNGRIDPEDTAGIAKVRIRLSGPAGTF